MRKGTLFLIFILGCNLLFAQHTKNISADFENASLTKVFNELESQSDFKFYYLEDWLVDATVTKQFQNEDLESVLGEVLSGTLLNYYIFEDRVIITKNNRIYDTVFSAKTSDTLDITSNDEATESLPIFVNENATSIKTFRIGKENARLTKKQYLLKGKVFDSKNGEALSNVLVLVENENKGTQTDVDGNFSISLSPGAHILTARTLGNNVLKKRVLMYSDGVLDFSVSQNLEMLDEVIVDSKSDRNIKEAFTGVSVLDVQRVKLMPLILGERDLLKAATTLPGISKAGEGALGFNVRGGRVDQNLILLDNGIIYNPNHFFGVFSAINPFTTGSVEIYKGNIPAKFGGRLSSVFDIKTKAGNTQELAGEGSIGPVTGNLSLEIPIIDEKSSLIIGGRATYSDWILKNLNEEALNNSEASFYDLIANYNHDFNDDNDLSITAYYSKDRFSITSDSLYSYGNRMISGTFKHKFNNDLEGSINLANSFYDFEIEYDSQFENDFLSSYKINDTKLQFNLDHKIHKKHNLNYGLFTKLYNISPGKIEPIGNDSSISERSLDEEKGVELAVYLADEYEISDKLLLNAGLRFSSFSSLGSAEVDVYRAGEQRNAGNVINTLNYDNNEIVQTYNGLEFRIGARYSIADDLSVKAGFNTSNQYIHTLSNNTLVSPTDVYKLSNSFIKPQRSRQYSLGLFKNIQDNKFEVSLEGYYKDIDDIIDFATGSTLFMNENIERDIIQGKGKSYGVEFLIRKNRGDLNGWLSYTYSRSMIQLDSEFVSQRVNQGDFFPSNYDKPHDFSAVLNYKITKRFSFSTNFVYQTGRPVTFPIGKYDFNNSQFVAYSDRNQYRIPDYYRLDLSFNAEGNHKIEKLAHSFWSFSIYNVLGRNNPYSVFFVTDAGEVKAYQSSIFAIPVPTITYNFKF